MGKKKLGSVRTTITVPGSIKREMDKVKEPVNWSAIATDAFSKKLAEIATKKKEKNMSDVVARLRASKQASRNDRYKQGKSLGEEWARDTAETEQLESLDLFQRKWQTESIDFFDPPNPETMAYSIGEVLFFEISPEDSQDRDSARDFWESAIGEECEVHLTNGEFLRGFVDGAVEVWDEVKNQI